MGMVLAHNLFGVVDEHMSDGRKLQHNQDEAERHPMSGQRDTVESHLRLGSTTAEKAAEKQRFEAEKAEIRLTWPSVGRWTAERVPAG